jgi:hypothetical protein
MARCGAVLIVMAAGCGRLGFSPGEAPPLDAAPGATPDAAGPPDAPAPAPIHRYRLDGDYTDDHGGPALVGLGGSFDAAGYRFAINQGLGLSNAMPVAVYTVDVKLAFDAMMSWRKVLDFKRLADDSGLYVHDAQLAFVEDAGNAEYVSSSALLVAATPFELTLTRGVDGAVVGYVNRVLEFSTTDRLGAGTFTEQDALAEFAIDDLPTSQQEASSGVIREIRIWGVALTADQVGQL